MNNFKSRCFAWLPSLRTAFAVFVILLVVGLPLSIYYVVTTIIGTVDDCYTQEWTASSVIEHLKTHDGAWPESWEDLWPTYKRLTDQAGYDAFGMEELQSRVEVDWYADVERLRRFANSGVGPPPRIIRLRNGREVHWAGADPNQILLEYFRSSPAEEVAQPMPAVTSEEVRIQNAIKAN